MRSSVVQEVQFPKQPALQLIYDTAPIGLAYLSPDCRYLQINQRLTEICGISVEGHLGRTVRDPLGVEGYATHRVPLDVISRANLEVEF